MAHTILRHTDDLPGYNALTKGAAYQRHRDAELVVATGSEVVPLLQGLVLNDLFTLSEPGRGELNAAVNNVGRLLSLFRVLHIDDLLLLDLPPGNIASGFLKHLKTHVINEDAKFKDKSAGVESFTIAGPNSLKLLEFIATPPRGYASLQAFCCKSIRLKLSNDTTADAILLRLDDLNEIDSFKLIVATEDAQSVEDRLCAEGTPSVAQSTYDFVRLEQNARARWGLELSEEIIPLEADLNPIVAYDKGCYLGQEIIARLDSRKRFAKRLCTIRWPYPSDIEGDSPLGPPPSPDTPLYFRDPKKNALIEAGRVIYAIDSESRGEIVARAYLKRPAHETGAEIIWLLDSPASEVDGSNESTPIERIGVATLL